MICKNCFEVNYEITKMDLEVMINGKEMVLPDVECDKCPKCGDISFTHHQSIALDKRRISLEFGNKPELRPDQLKLFRKLLDVSLEEICENLNIGKNTYGRWERGEIGITPSMNLLVHSYIDRFPGIKTNIIDLDRRAAIDRARGAFLRETSSIGTFLQSVIDKTDILLNTICYYSGISPEDMEIIITNDKNPEDVEPIVFARLAKIFSIDFYALKLLLDNAMSSYFMKGEISTIHARSVEYNKEAKIIEERSIAKIIGTLLSENNFIMSKKSISDNYISRLKEAIRREDSRIFW